MKIILRKLFSLLLILSMFMCPSVCVHAESDKDPFYTEMKMFETVKDLNLSEITASNKKIRKVINKENYIEFDRNSQKYIGNYQIYVIDDMNKGEEKTATIVTDIKLNGEGIKNLSGPEVKSSGGSLYDEKNCGRVTSYIKVTYTNKTFEGISSSKITKIQGKLTNVQGGVTIRKLVALYRGYGFYYKNNGAIGQSGTYTKSYNFSVDKARVLQTADTSSIDRYYPSNGAGALGGAVQVTYGGTTAASQATYQVHINVCDTVWR